MGARFCGTQEKPGNLIFMRVSRMKIKFPIFLVRWYQTVRAALPQMAEGNPPQLQDASGAVCLYPQTMRIYKMINFPRSLILMVLFMLGLAACAPGAQAAASPLTDGSSGPAVAAGAPVSSPVPALKGGKPPQTHAAGILPPERRAELTRLSSLLQFKVTGWNGVALGQVTDFVINTCETYIIYFTVAPDAALKVASGSQLVIPFEVVTINSGALDAEAKSISIYMTPDQVSASPVFPAPLTLLPYSPWEESVRAYWMSVARVGMLKSECKAGGSNAANAVHKIAYATQLIGAELKDGNHTLLGTVQDAVLEPESGKLGFYIVKLVDGSLVMVPLGQTNIPKEALAPGQTIELVLLAKNELLWGAPRIGSVEGAMNAQTQSEARQYWKK
jgi:sporulation protein YlmC with PRC-barrel domain